MGSSLLGSLPWLVTGAMTGFVAYCNLPSAWIMPAAKATSIWLSEAQVKPVLSDRPAVNAASLWKDKGVLKLISIIDLNEIGFFLCCESYQKKS